MKERTVDIVSWEYIKEKDEYIIKFRISGLKPEMRKVIIEKHESGFLNSQGAEIEEIVEVEDNLYIKELYEKEYLENFKSLIPLAQKGIIPERLDRDKLEIEVEISMIEEDMKFRIEHLTKGT